ncbi:MAG: carboxymuconolactone decarboxylase family protein [Ignavibacteriales bacterium]|nr:MAG: carboxymuconolactone decarboxylase family protein [Ignavibacteriales bacterium]
MSTPPKFFQKFSEEFPEIFKAYEELGNSVHSCGPLDKKTRTLIKLAVSAGARLEGAVHSQTKKAIEAGASKEEIRQTILLALPTVGLPQTMAALSWVEDILVDKTK